MIKTTYKRQHLIGNLQFQRISLWLSLWGVSQQAGKCAAGEVTEHTSICNLESEIEHWPSMRFCSLHLQWHISSNKATPQSFHKQFHQPWTAFSSNIQVSIKIACNLSICLETVIVFNKFPPRWLTVSPKNGLEQSISNFLRSRARCHMPVIPVLGRQM